MDNLFGNGKNKKAGEITGIVSQVKLKVKLTVCFSSADLGTIYLHMKSLILKTPNSH